MLILFPFHTYEKMRPQTGKAILLRVIHLISNTAKIIMLVCLALKFMLLTTIQCWEDNLPKTCPGDKSIISVPRVWLSSGTNLPSLSWVYAVLPHPAECPITDCGVSVPWPGPLPLDTPSGTEGRWLRGKRRGLGLDGTASAWIESHSSEWFHATTC